MIYKALTQDHYLNARPPTPEEEEKLKVILIEAEQKAQSKHDSIKAAHDRCLRYRAETLIHNHKRRHLSVLKGSGMGISELETLVTSIDISPDISIRHTPPIRGGLAELQKKGLKITDYHTTEKT